MSDTAPTTSTQETYQVLARKYRPATFEDIIGQDSMVKTLTNAFRTGRVAHAFMLTGVRGIGKTTTARLLARALNYETDEIDHPSVDLSTLGHHCDAIMRSSHMDVLEMDAASRTGVDNMRELLDGVRYAPVEARYKVYIIDEVHMLSTGAFNALLKTLEEPPDHAKFIFATTEIRKVPITVLSRCQRFDLRRVDVKALHSHLSDICKKETVSISDAGLSLIARAAEGSVRDGLSLLDQAIVQSDPDNLKVSSDQVRVMLGLADRERIVDLFAMVMQGDRPGALGEVKAQYDDGADPVVIMSDLLNTCHAVNRAKAVGDTIELDMSPDQAARLSQLAETLTQGQLTRAWQILLASYHDVRIAPEPLACAEMAVLKLALAAEMPPPELAAKIIEEIQAGNFTPPELSSATQGVAAGTRPSESGPQTKSTSSLQSGATSDSRPDSRAALSSAGPTSSTPPSSAATISAGSGPSTSLPASAPRPNAPMPVKTPSTTVHIENLSDFVANLPDTDRTLKFDIETYVKVIRFGHGSITIENLDGAPRTLVGRMVGALRDITGDLWLINQEAGQGAPTLREARNRAQKERDTNERAHPAFAHPLLKDATLLEIRDADNKVSEQNNVISGHFQNSQDEDA